LFGEHELTLVIGAPQIIGRVAWHSAVPSAL
jgi:hypothetical protein